MPSRRFLLGTSLASFAVYALLREVRLGAAPRPVGDVAGWLARQDELAVALAEGSLRARDWQAEIERLARAVDLDALRDALHGAELRDTAAAGANDPRKRTVSFLDDHGERRHFRYGTALFEFRPGDVITPHGHRHMASAHLVLDGALRVRNFDRLRDEGAAMVLRPTVDRVLHAGEISTMSSERDNVHWFVPVSKRATTFDVIVSQLDPGEQAYTIETVDPLGAARLADGSLLAPKIDFATSARRYARAV